MKNNKPTFDGDTIRHNDEAHWLHPWENLTSSFHSNQRIIIDRAEGVYLYDDKGRELIDGQGGMWCVQIGYGRKEMAEAIADQVMRMNYMSPFHATSEPSALLAKSLAAKAPKDLKHVFFTTGGSTAVDSAIRFVFLYHNVKKQPNRNQIIARSHSYHGSTYMSASVSSRDKNEEYLNAKSANIHFLEPVNIMDIAYQKSPESYCAAKVREFEKKIQEIGPQNIAAFIAEPIQASGGVVIAPPGYLAECSELCKKHDILYISDEVVTGFGRLGHWFASTPVFNVTPDILICAKGLSSGYLPIGALLISDSLINEIKSCHIKDLTLNLGFTYSGHPVCAAAALKNIEIIEREGLLAYVQDISDYFQNKLLELTDIPIVADVHGMGLLGAVHCRMPHSNTDLSDVAFNKIIALECRNAGLFVRSLEDQVVLSPPLIITPSQIDIIVERLRLGIEKAQYQIVKK